MYNILQLIGRNKELFSDDVSENEKELKKSFPNHASLYLAVLALLVRLL